jgi:hypothetical protein
MALTPNQLRDRRLLFRPCRTRDELHDWLIYFLDLDLPGTQVDSDSDSSPLDMVWDVYARLVHGEGGSLPPLAPQVLYYSCREGGKSLAESVIEVILLLHFRAPLIHLAAIERQSLDVQGYIEGFFSKPALVPFVKDNNKRATSACFYVPSKELQDKGAYHLTAREWGELPGHLQDQYRKIVNKVEVIVAEMQSVNGKHGILIMDELDVLEKPNVFKQCPNIPSQVVLDDGTIRLPLTIYTSTRKTAFGLVQDLITKKEDPEQDFDLEIRHWNILDKTDGCPKERHRPDLPKVPVYLSNEDLKAVSEENIKNLTPEDQAKYKKTEGYWGCFNNCKMFGACQGRLANREPSKSKFLNIIDATQSKFRTNDIDTAKAELMCRKPGSSGLIYGSFDKKVHVINPNQAYHIITKEDHPNPRMGKDEFMQWATMMFPDCWYGGMDFGFSHNFAYSNGLQVQNTMFITHVVAGKELNPDQKMTLCAPFKKLSPFIYGDTENPEAIKIFKTNGWRMAKWRKLPGSLHGGISIVKIKLSPHKKETPEMFFIRDLGTDPMMDLAIKHFAEHHWKLDAAGEPTKNVSDKNKDIPDSIRYLIMNRFTPKGQTISSSETTGSNSVVDQYGNAIYNEATWLPQKVAELIGVDSIDLGSLNPTIATEGTFESYYNQMTQDSGKNKPKGRQGGFVFDLS